jgi:predicted unusual protein kinase regulating ubiquinone biosynthesis (AarF/ABC1/UbiB family)
MPAARAEALIKGELGIDSLEEVFDWIELSKPLGSASISQVGRAGW